MGLWQALAGLSIASVIGAAVHSLRAHDGVAADVRRAVRRPATWLVGVPTLLLVLLVGVPFVYLRSIATTPPKPLSFDDVFAPTTTTTNSSTAASDAVAAGPAPSIVAIAATNDGAPALSGPAPTAADLSGTWSVGQGTQARYSIDDTAVGQTQKVVGATPDVTGSMAIADTTVTMVSVTVNMQTVTCNCVHDAKYHEMLETDKYPTSTFELTSPIVLDAIPPEGEAVRLPVTGNFTIHGVTREVSFTLDAMRRDGRVAVNGQIPIKLEDYNIDNPDAGAFGGLDNCAIEFLVAFDRAS